MCAWRCEKGKLANCFVTTLCWKCKRNCSPKTSDWWCSTYKYFAMWIFYWLIFTHINSLLDFYFLFMLEFFFIYFILITSLLEIWQSSQLLFNVLFTGLFSLIVLVRLWFILFILLNLKLLFPCNHSYCYLSIVFDLNF